MSGQHTSAGKLWKPSDSHTRHSSTSDIGPFGFFGVTWSKHSPLKHSVWFGQLQAKSCFSLETVGVCASLSLESVEQWREDWMNKELVPASQQPPSADRALFDPRA